MRKVAEKIKNWPKKKKILAVGIVFLCVAVLAAAVLIGMRLGGEKNGSEVFSEDFENGSGGLGTEAYYENITRFSYSREGGVDGSGCVVIESAEGNDARYITEVKVREGKYYRIAGDVKAENLSGENAYGANISVIGSLVRYPFPVAAADGQWHRLEYYIKAPSGGSMTLALRLGYYSGDTAGKASFDNVSVTRVDSVPEGAVYIDLHSSASPSETITETADWNEGTYSDTRLIAVFLVIGLLAVFLIAYRYSRAYDGFGRTEPLAHPWDRELPLRTAVVILFVSALVLRLLLSVTYFQCDIDVNLFKAWGKTADASGLPHVYEKYPGIDYPPLFLHFLWAAAFISRLLSPLLGGAQDAFYTMLVKLPSCLADCAIGYLIYRAAGKKSVSTEWRLFFAALWLFNPITLLDSALWGQVDSITALFVVLCIMLLNEKRYLPAGVMLGLGIMLKPQMLIFSPIFFYMWLKDAVTGKSGQKALKSLGLSAGGTLAGALIPNLLFLGMGMEEIPIELPFLEEAVQVRLPWIFSLFIGTVNHYSYTSVNCYNFWFLLGKNWVADDEMAGPLSLHLWGMIAIVLVSLLVLFLYWKSKSAEYVPYLMAGLLYLGVSNFGPRMHERYFFPAVALLLIAAILTNKKSLLGLYALLSAGGFLSVWDVMVGLQVGTSLRNAGVAYEKYAYYYWPSLNGYRGCIALLMVASALLTVALACIAALQGEERLGSPIYLSRARKNGESGTETVPAPPENGISKAEGKMSLASAIKKDGVLPDPKAPNPGASKAGATPEPGTSEKSGEPSDRSTPKEDGKPSAPGTDDEKDGGKDGGVSPDPAAAAAADDPAETPTEALPETAPEGAKDGENTEKEEGKNEE